MNDMSCETKFFSSYQCYEEETTESELQACFGALKFSQKLIYFLLKEHFNRQSLKFQEIFIELVAVYQQD